MTPAEIKKDQSINSIIHLHARWWDTLRQSIDPPVIPDRDMDFGLRLLILYYYRSLNAAATQGLTHPPLHVYTSCLSQNFGHGCLKDLRRKELIPKYSRVMAKKYGIEPGMSYVTRNPKK